MAGRGIFPAMVDKMSGAPGYCNDNRARLFYIELSNKEVER